MTLGTMTKEFTPIEDFLFTVETDRKEGELVFYTRLLKNILTMQGGRQQT